MKSVELFEHHGEAIRDSEVFSILQLCRYCQITSRHVFQLVEQGAIEPLANQPDEWHFSAHAANRALRAARMERDLGINTAGAALALELLDELERLKTSMH